MPQISIYFLFLYNLSLSSPVMTVSNSKSENKDTSITKRRQEMNAT